MSRIISRISNLWRYAQSVKQEIVEQNGSMYDRVQWRVFVDLLVCYNKYGLLPSEYVALGFYRLNKRARNSYMTSSRSGLIGRRLNPPSVHEIMVDKTKALTAFSKYIHRRWLLIDGHTPEEAIVEFAQSLPEYIVKPVNGTFGKGISKHSGGGYLLNINELEERFLVEEVVKNHPAIARLNPSSLNTLRVNTCIDGEGKLHIFNVALRVGGEGMCVDNLSSGGVCYPVDLEKGQVNGPGMDHVGRRYMVHPSSGIFMPGYRLPFYEQLHGYVTELSSVLPEARWVGWDIAITESGLDLVECNPTPGMDSVQHWGGRYFDIQSWIQ